MKQLLVAVFLFLPCFDTVVFGQDADAAKVERGSKTAKGGFQNEDEIRDKFNNWQTDAEARAWLEAMNHSLAAIDGVSASKPHGEKADVEVTVKTKSGERVERISIKLVSSPNGFNQIDKRWLKTYATKWKMPPDVVDALKLFVGETPPRESGRDSQRMYLNELDGKAQRAVVDFFTANKDEIVSDMLAGDGDHSADWMIVAWKATDKPKWVIRSSADAIKFYGEGPVELTKAGNLKIGRITMQRKGGDNGRERPPRCSSSKSTPFSSSMPRSPRGETTTDLTATLPIHTRTPGHREAAPAPATLPLP